MFYGEKPLNKKCAKTAYSNETALFMAKAARLAYEPYKNFCRLSESELSVKKNDIYHSTFESSQVFIFEHQDSVVVVFRGTEMMRIEDWVSDLKFKTVALRDGSAHVGFLSAYRFVAGDIVATVLSLLNKKKNSKLYITGHSLGGAAAFVCAYEFYLLGLRVSGVYTFGQPRVADKKLYKNFPEDLSSCIYRFANDNDIVPRVPPRKMGFMHIGNPRFFTEDGKLHMDKKEWRKFKRKCPQKAKTVLGRLFELVGQYVRKIGDNTIELLTDHKIDEYVKFLEKL